MSQIRSSNYYYFKRYNIPINTFKYVFFNRLKNNFESIILTQTNENSGNMMRCTHHIAIQYESRVKPEYVADIIRSTYQGFTVESLKVTHFDNILKKLSREDKNPLFKGFNIKQLR